VPILCLLALTSAQVRIGPVGFYGLQPQVATSGSRAFVACGQGDRVFVLASKDAGRTFGSPVALPTTGKLMLGMRRGPRVAISGRAVVVSAVYGQKGGGADGDLFSWRSRDEGRTWVGPVRVSDVPGAAREGLHAMAASSTGRLAATWLDLRGGGTEIWAASSDDGGASWGKNVRVYRSPDGHVCECCHPSAAFGPKGELYVMFRNWLGGARDMYLSASRDGGATFGAAQRLGVGTWPLNACPMDGGSIGVAADGSVTTVWRRGGRVYLSQPGKPETEVGEGFQPWMSGDGAVVWELKGRIFGMSGGKVRELGAGSRPMVDGGLAVWADDAGVIWSERLGPQ